MSIIYPVFSFCKQFLDMEFMEIISRVDLHTKKVLLYKLIAIRKNEKMLVALFHTMKTVCLELFFINRIFFYINENALKKIEEDRN